ncbi:MAG: glycosyltransferase family 39 protein [Anaerolineaceae bacterium]|nr:glycosyltransferase family 39 protein [Anaerolineaceae bacterium]
MRRVIPRPWATAGDGNGLARLLPMLILLALLLRLLAVLAEDHAYGYVNDGSDGPWYLAHGYALVTGFDNGRLSEFGDEYDEGGVIIVLRRLTTPPLYLLFNGLPQAFFPREAAVLLIRVFQALAGAISVWLVWRLGRAVTGSEGAAFVAALAIAVSPAFIFEATRVTTESLYIFLLLAALAHHSHRRKHVAMTGILLGLATLTRAVLLLFPLALALHLLLVDGRRQGLRQALLLLAAYSLVVGSWTVYSLARWDRFVIAGEGMAAFLYIGALEQGWRGPQETDRQLVEDIGAISEEPQARQANYLQGAQGRISADPVGYLLRRLDELTRATLQPHGTGYFDGPPLRLMAIEWWREGRSPFEVLQWTTSEGFWPRLLIYVLHFVGLLAGLVGLWFSRQRWRQSLPLVAFIAYTLLLHLALHAIPRYLFPILPLCWVFAGVALLQAYEKLKALRR